MRKVSAKKRKSDKVYKAVCAEVAERSGGRCELGCGYLASQFHHRLPRSQGGKHTVLNLLHVCGHHHDFIHAYPAWAYACGYLLRRSNA